MISLPIAALLQSLSHGLVATHVPDTTELFAAGQWQALWDLREASQGQK
jgi:O-antigen/teichoic acid export membrane protein